MNHYSQEFIIDSGEKTESLKNVLVMRLVTLTR